MKGRASAAASFICLLLALAACAKPVIRGRVVDMFKQPVAGVEVSIPNTAFSAVSGVDGTYAISFAPGQFALHFKKPEYASETVPWNVSQSAELPAADVMLYPNPKQGVYLVRRGKLVPLPPVFVKDQVTPPGAFSRTQHTYSFQEPDTKHTVVVSLNTEERFIETLPLESHFYCGSPAFYGIEGVGEFMPFVTLDGELKTTNAEVGEEKVRIRTVKFDRKADFCGWLRGPVGKAQQAYVVQVSDPNEVE